ncbi:FAD-dependent oxidoreductase [Nocardioides sp. CN2-186]|uniref:NAD(P)/FAD-dependent oxidoreductase n=1 Tax=Nocardioides tweenelious TaxID=3156607 RepID=UPI0032B5E980
MVVVGGGVAGLRCVEGLRREGSTSSITLVHEERMLPYERPPLSKKVLTGERSVESLEYQSPDYFQSLQVDLVQGPALALDLESKSVLVGPRSYRYDDLVICTGAASRRLPTTVVSPTLPGVFYLRTADDASRLAEALPRARSVIVVGAGFVGSEVASSARAMGAPVTVIEVAPIPLARVLGAEMAAECAQLHRRNGTTLMCGHVVTGIRGDGGVEFVELADGTLLPADLVVVGIGAEANVEWLVGSGLPIGDGVLCDDRLQASADGVHAIGDVASWADPTTGLRQRFEQWTVAIEQAKYVARQIVNPSRSESFTTSNYFWSEQYGVNMQFVGSTLPGDATSVWAARGEGRLFALYRSRERLTAAFAIDAPRDLMRAKGLIESGVGWDAAMEAFPGHHFDEVAARSTCETSGSRSQL